MHFSFFLKGPSSSSFCQLISEIWVGTQERNIMFKTKGLIDYRKQNDTVSLGKVGLYRIIHYYVLYLLHFEDIDQLWSEAQSFDPNSPQPFDKDLPGGGQFYCPACGYNFITPSASSTKPFVLFLNIFLVATSLVKTYLNSISGLSRISNGYFTHFSPKFTYRGLG